MSHPHGKTALVSTPVVTVSACACGHVHVDLGATTLRFEAAAFREVARALDRAAQRLPTAPLLRSAPAEEA